MIAASYFFEALFYTAILFTVYLAVRDLWKWLTDEDGQL